MERLISKSYLRDHPNEIFVYGDNLQRTGKGGAAIFRSEPNTHGFITKKFPSYHDSSFFHPEEYKSIFEKEFLKLEKVIVDNPDKKYLISRIGGGLAGRFGIFEKVILPRIVDLKKYQNVEFLFEI